MRVAWAVVGIGVLCTLAACSSAGPAEHGANVVPTTGAAPGPGNPLDDGLVVPVGAHLLGRVFPGVVSYTGELIPDTWFALLVVDGDGRASFSDLVDQAHSIGFSDARASPPVCRSRFAEPVFCDVTIGNGISTVMVHTEVGPCGPRGSSHMTLSGQRRRSSTPPVTVPKGSNQPSPAPSATTPAPATTAGTTATASATTALTGRTSTASGPIRAPTTAEPLPLPGPGDLLNPREPLSAPVYLEPGSVLAGPPMVSCADYGAEHWSVIAIGDPVDQVVHAYSHQFAAHDRNRSPIVARGTAGPTRLTALATDQGGKGRWRLTVAEEDGQPPWGLIKTYTDP